MFRLTKKLLPFINRKGFHSSKSLKAQIEIFIDDKPVKVDSSLTIFQACHEAGVIIPRFCYHERLSVAGNCRMCLVEVEKSPKPVASCAAQVMPGMKVYTKSERTRIARGGVMEFLLANHPLDCPICDQGGECDLQDISQVYGYGEGRYMEYKRAVEDKNIGPIVSTSMNRCIHCTRCIRFSEQVAGVLDLGTSGRGKATEIGTYVDRMIDSELSGNLVDLCPVGALTSGPYAFTSRPWELKSVNSVDLMDSLGSAIQYDYRGSEIMRVLPRIHEDINEEWISDKSRHAFDGLKKQRLTVPLKRTAEGSFNEITWEEAIKEVAQKLTNAPGNQISGLVGEFSDVEAIVALKDLLNRLDSETLEFGGKAQNLNSDLRSDYIMNSSIVGIEDSDLLLLVGTNPRFEAPVLNSRIIKATRRGSLKVALVGTPQDLNYEYLHLGNSTRVLQEIASGKHPFAERLSKAKLPMILIGANALERADGQAVYNTIKSFAKNTPVISAQNGWNGLNILHREGSRVGALDIGVSPRRSGNVQTSKVVILLGTDNIKPSDIPKDAFVVYIGTHGDEGAYYADVILPGAAFTEKNGTFVNTEGRTQLTRLVVQPPGLARNDWEILRALSEECGQTLPYDTQEEIRYRIAELAPHLLKYDYIEPSIFGDIAALPTKSKQQLIISPLADNIDNFYMTDAVSRQSVVMAKCSTAFNHVKFSNFKKLQI